MAPESKPMRSGIQGMSRRVRGLGLSLATVATIMGSASPAEALVYVFEGVTFDYASPLSFFTGSGSISGSFNAEELFPGGPIVLDQVSVTFVSNDANTAGFTFPTGSSSNAFFDPGPPPPDGVQGPRLAFGAVNPGTFEDCDNGPDVCLDLNLQAGLTLTPFEVINFNTGTDNLGTYFNTANDNIIFNFSNRRDLTITGGILRAVPTPFSAALLLPLSALIGYRRRLRRLSSHSSQ